MSAMNTYEVTVERGPGTWIIRVPAIPSVLTQARQLADVGENAREAIAVWLDLPCEAVDVTASVAVFARSSSHSGGRTSSGANQANISSVYVGAPAPAKRLAG
jgi:predicted RNase H-like HicB family nuclease